MNSIESPIFLFRESCNRITPEIGRIIIYTSVTSANAANGIESLSPMLSRDVSQFSSQLRPGGGMAPTRLAIMKAV